MPTLFERFNAILNEIVKLPGTYKEKKEHILSHSDPMCLSEFLSWFDDNYEDEDDDEEEEEEEYDE